FWRSDGTAVGTFPVRDDLPGTSGDGFNRSSFYPNAGAGGLTIRDATLSFYADGTPLGTTFWRSDGTPAGTVPVGPLDQDPTAGGVYGFALGTSRLVFRWSDPAGFSLWKSDDRGQNAA